MADEKKVEAAVEPNDETGNEEEKQETTLVEKIDELSKTVTELKGDDTDLEDLDFELEDDDIASSSDEDAETDPEKLREALRREREARQKAEAQTSRQQVLRKIEKEYPNAHLLDIKAAIRGGAKASEVLKAAKKSQLDFERGQKAILDKVGPQLEAIKADVKKQAEAEAKAAYGGPPSGTPSSSDNLEEQLAAATKAGNAELAIAIKNKIFEQQHKKKG